ncbi:MAG: helix-turn-helix domain-containing protein [Oscillospiraceae bacterium]|nr:helix-turn-helix domain-containing protein [Oscillospiraceae bacterium]
MEKITEIRTAKGLSMYRFTQIKRISEHHIKEIEERTQQLTIDTLKKLSVLLGISMAELFSEETDSTYLTEKE